MACLESELVTRGIGVAAFGIVALAAWIPLGCVWRQVVRPARLARCGLAAVAVAAGLLMLRPHEDAFVGLDTSGYRNMTRAFAAGRALHGADAALLQVPRTLRTAFLMDGRLDVWPSRDRSFRILSDDTCATEPCFYPTLPLVAAGLDQLVPGAADYALPLLAAVFLFVWVAVGAALGGVAGGSVAFALWLGSPLPVWVFRGYFTEALGALLIAAVLMAWLLRVRGATFAACGAFALGLSTACHPALGIVALPMLALLLLEHRSRLPRSWVLVGGAIGFLPLWALTRWICQPYGDFLNLQAWMKRLAGDPTLRLAVVGVAAAALALGAVVLLPDRWRNAALRWVKARLATVTGTGVALLVAAAPLAAALTLWAQRGKVRMGVDEGLMGVGPVLGLLVLVGMVFTLRPKAELRPKLAVLGLWAVAPLFLFLKGLEQMGLWSQRRLLPWWLLLIVALLPGIVGALAWAARGGRWRSLAAGTFIVAAAVANLVRWPAPWTIRFDRGADRWTALWTERMAGRLVVMDYYHNCQPYAVLPGSRVLGLSKATLRRLPEVAVWLRERSAVEAVAWGTAYANPGIEDGVVLAGEGREMTTLPRIRSHGALPAAPEPWTPELELLAVRPADPARPPELHKTFDGGPLALRGPWGPRRTVTLPDGTSSFACWSREGSGVVGPVPPRGGAVQVRIEGSASRAVAGQTLRVVAPWGGVGVLTLPPGKELHTVEVTIPRGASDVSPEAAATGVYQLHAETPYDPTVDGLRDYDPDLGAVLRTLSIAVES